MSTTETYQSTVQPADTKDELSTGAQLPHSTIALAASMPAPSGGDPATQTVTLAAEPNVEPLSGSQPTRPANSVPNSNARTPGGDSNSVTDQVMLDAQATHVGHGATSTASHSRPEAQRSGAGRGSTSALDQDNGVTHDAAAEGGTNSQQATGAAETRRSSPAGADAGQDRTARGETNPTVLSLFDPALAFAADILDDTEGLWVANANRLRTLTTAADQEDADGVCRGFGLTETHPDVARLAAMVATLEQLTKDATKHLEKVMRRHPLHPWVKAQKGLGDKQTARLLAAIGDPYWNTLHDRPRTVSELWSYSGLGDAAKQVRRRGQKANWSADAKKRAWLIANSIVKAGGPYRKVYDATKEGYADAVHTEPCVRCGPSGKPAAAGSPLSKAHIHGRALRAVSKEVLKDLWVEAKRLHELPAGDQGKSAAQIADVAGRGQT